MKTTTQNDWPGSAPRIKPERQGSGRRALSLWLFLRQACTRVLSVAWCEILLQLRSIVLWVMLAAFTLLTVLYARTQVSNNTNYSSNQQATVAICTYAASFIFFLLPFLFMNIFARDRRHQAHQLIWTRPLASAEYALGKGLGAVGISFLASWTPLLIGWLATSVFRSSVQPLLLWLQMLLVVGAVDILITLCTLFLVALFSPLAVLGALIPAGLVVYVDIAFPKSMLFLSDITATTLFASPGVGFGPDGTLLLWQRFSYVMGGLFCLGSLMLIYQVRERLGAVQVRHILSTTLFLIVTGGILFASVLTYQVKGAAYTDSGLLTAKPIQATTSQYELDVTANPTSGEVHGTASFVLTPQGAQGSGFFIGLNPGVHVQQIELLSTNASNMSTISFAEVTAGWTRIELQGTGFEVGQAVDLRISYAGQMILGRDDYAQAASGYGLSEGVSWSQDYFYLSYLGQGMGELLGAAGSWYPLPFTQQALDDGMRIPIDEMHLRFPKSLKVLSGLASATTTLDGDWQEIIAQPHASLPVALAVALSSAQQESVDDLSFWYQGEAPDQIQLSTYRATMQEFQAMNHWLAPAGTSQVFQTVIVPMLPLPAVGAGLLLLPERPALNPANPITLTTMARIAAGNLAQAWWLNAALFPFTTLTGGSDTQNPEPSTSIQPTNALLDMLSQYSAAVITGAVIGSNFFTNEMNICAQAYALPPSQTESQQAQVLQQEMARLGTSCMPMELVPYRLSFTKGVGFARLTSFLRQYAFAHTEQKTDMRQFLHQASILAGKNIIPEAAPYICPGGEKTTPAQGAADPLTCLNENYSGT